MLDSRHKGIDSEAGNSSSRTALGSLQSRLRISADQSTSMRTRRRRRDHARSGLTPEADFPITTSRSSGVPLSQISNLPDVSLARKDAKTQAVKYNHKSMPRPSLRRLVPELLGQALIQLGEVSLGGDILRVLLERHGKAAAPMTTTFPRVCGIHRALIVFSLETLVSAYDSGILPFSLTSIMAVSSSGDASLKVNGFVFSIPPDCPTSTPVASRKRAFRKFSAGSGATASGGVDPSLAMTRAIGAVRH